MTSETQEAAIAEGRRLYGAKQFKPALKQFTIVCIKRTDLTSTRLLTFQRRCSYVHVLDKANAHVAAARTLKK
jgi:hypothetical protein